MNQEIVLSNWMQAHAFLNELAKELKPRLLGGHRIAITVGEPKRSLDQNARLHAMLTDVSRQAIWAGKRHTVDVWKRLMTGAWLRATGEHVEIIPAIDGKGFDVIYEPTSRMSKGQVTSLMDFVEAWGAENGVTFSEREALTA